MSWITRHAALVAVMVLGAFAWLPLVTPGYFMQAHDAAHSLFFLQAYDEVIRDGHWWPAWGPNFAFGYGYPLFIFYAPLTYMLGETFHLLGANITTAMKLVDIAATVGAALSMYLWARRHFGRPAAALSAVVYTFAPYHLLDLYVRSAAAEYATFAFFPLVLWRWETLLHSPTRRNTLLAALVTALLILTHHGAAFIFALLLAAYLLFQFARMLIRPEAGTRPQRLSLVQRQLLYGLAAAVLTLGLSAIFWLPVLAEQKYIVVEQWTSISYNYQKHFVFSNQFFSPFWGYGYSGEGLADGMGLQLGLMPIGLGIFALVAGGPALAGRRDRRALTMFFLAASLTIAYLMSPVSAGFWQAVPIAALVQFPWRLLALSTITMAWLAGVALEAVLPDSSATERLHPLAAVLMATVALAGFNYTLPQYTERSLQGESARAAVDFESVSYKDRTGYMTWASEQPSTSPLVPEYKAGQPLSRAVVSKGEATLTPVHYGGEDDRLQVESANGAEIQFRVYYFPGWRASIDGQAAPLWPSGPQALIALQVPPGKHDVEIQFEDTKVRGLAKAISVISVLIVMGWASIGVAGKRAIRSGLAAALIGAVFMLPACDPASSATPAATIAPTTVASAPDAPTATSAPTSTATPTATSTAANPPTPRPATVQHVVQPNETIIAIAQQYGVTVDAILKANNITDPRLLRTGQTLIIPLPTLTPTPPATATPNQTQAALPPTPTPNVYVVQGGDVLSAIAAKYNIPVDDIMAANGLKDTFLRVGQQLVIPPPTPTPTQTATPLPTSTPTPRLPFEAPALLFPANGSTFNGDDTIVLNWTSVGVLGTDQYYVVRVRKTDGARNESVWLKTPSYRLVTDWRGGTIEWDVIVLQLTNTNPNGTKEGTIQSPFSATRQFSWK